jgi:hypothetical protein
MELPATALPAFLEDLLNQNNANSERATHIAGGLERDQLTWRPAPSVWGVGHCLDHLRLGAEVYFPTIESTIARARTRNLIAPPDMQHRYTWMGRMLINALSPNAKRKIRAPRDLRPPADPPQDVYDRFQASQARLGELINEIGQFNVNRMRMSSPELRIIRMNVADALEMLVAHAERHLNQAEAVTRHTSFPRR